MSMRCLVLGGSGFIGQAVVGELVNQGFHVVVGDLVKGATESFIRVDFTDQATINHIMNGIDVVVHLAWTTVPQSSTDDPAKDIQNNVIGSLNVLNACVEAGVKRIIYISSGGAVYGIPSVIPIPETHPTLPISSYGVTKLTVENYVHLYSSLHGLEFFILRPGNAYGEGQSSSRRQGIIAAYLAAIYEQKPFTIWGDGEIVRDYIHVTDIAFAVAQAVISQDCNQTLNIGTGRGTSVKEIIRLAEQITKSRTRVEFQPQRPIDPPINILNISRAGEILDWYPEIPLEEGVARQWRVIKERIFHS